MQKDNKFPVSFRKMAECERDLDFIASLPGRKILVRGNHDCFWDAGKIQERNLATHRKRW